MSEASETTGLLSSNKTPAREAGRDGSGLHWKKSSLRGPLGFMNATRADVDFDQDSRDQNANYTSRYTTDGKSIHEEWRARDNRKGRHVLLVAADRDDKDSPGLSSNLSSVGANIWRMFTQFPYWDVSWWIAVFFTVGCALFVVCGVFQWFPMVSRSDKLEGDDLTPGIAAFIGATLFAFGGVLLVVEATNENQTGCFGWAILQTYEQVRSGNESDDVSEMQLDRPESLRVQPLVNHSCQHLHSGDRIHNLYRLHEQHPNVARTWEWWPTWKELTTHYVYDIGFLASSILAVGTIIFLISGIMSLPQINSHVSTKVMFATYWLAYLVGGLHFVTASVLYMVETQDRWYVPNPRALGWWVGAWNLVGSIGWTMSASFGYCQETWCTFQSHLSLLWASCAFLIGSLLLWYEAMEKYPVERERMIVEGG